MDRLCTRCVRTQLLSECTTRRLPLVQFTRAFSSSKSTCEDGDAPKSKSPSAPLQRGGKPTSDAARGTQAGRPGGLVIRREPTGGPAIRSQQGQSPPDRPLIIRRTTSPERSPILRRAPGGPPQGQLLRRTGESSSSGPLLRRSGARTSPTAFRGQGKQSQQRKKRRPANRSRESEDGDGEEPTEAELEEYMTKYLDRPANPTEQITYNPRPQSMKELRKDWPNTLLSPIGMTASVIQKIEWLARRIPHGYQTPEQIAEHFYKGNLTRFQSQKEKATVIRIAQGLAKKRADEITDKKGEQISPEDMSVSELGTNVDDKNSLVTPMVKGAYTELEKQRMPFLDSIVRTLRNNETYGATETSKFMAKIQSVMPPQAAKRTASQKAS